MFACGDWQISRQPLSPCGPVSWSWHRRNGDMKRAKSTVQEQFGAHRFLHGGQVRPHNVVTHLLGWQRHQQARLGGSWRAISMYVSASTFSNNNKTQWLSGLIPHYWHNWTQLLFSVAEMDAVASLKGWVDVNYRPGEWSRRQAVNLAHKRLWKGKRCQPQLWRLNYENMWLCG